MKSKETFDTDKWKWNTLVDVNGEDLQSKKGDGYDFVLANIPSGYQ